MSISAKATINTSRKDNRLGIVDKSYNVQLNGSMLVETMRRLQKAIVDKMDKMPDDEFVGWTDIQISLTRIIS